MASGANSIPLGRFIPKAPAEAVTATASLLKPAYVAGTGRSSRFSDAPNPSPAVHVPPPPPADRKSVSSRDYDRDDERDHYHGKSRTSQSSRNYNGADDEDSRSTSSRFTSQPVVSGEHSREGSEEPAKKKRKSRWAEISEVRAFIPGMPTIIPSHLTKDQEKAYLLQLQIEDYSRKLRTGDLGISVNAEERSPSPEPIYNHEGKRLNTRDMRTRRKYEDERHKLIQQMFDLNPDYKPPQDYKAPLARYTDKVVIPQDDHPEINFVGLLIGPRGNTLKQLEKDSFTKIIIRGKGSVKEGKIGRGNRDPLPGEDEPLHAYITGQSPETVKGAVERIKRILMEGIEVPEHQNDLRKQQLRELALLNGTLRDETGPRCSNCGSTAHRTWNCPDKPNITHSIICNRCGGTGHIAKDCKADITKTDNAPVNMDDEYLSLMAELGQGTPAPKPKPVTTIPPQIPRPFPLPQQQQAGPGQPQYGAVPPPPPANPALVHQQQQQQQQQHFQQQQQQHFQQQQHLAYGGAPPPPPPLNGMGQPQQYGGYYGGAPPPPPPQHNPYGYPPYGPPQPQWPPQQQQFLPPPPPPPPAPSGSGYNGSLLPSPGQAQPQLSAFAGMAQWATLPPPPPPPPPAT